MHPLSEKVVITHHEKFEQYDLGEGHPFRGDRFTNSRKFFEEQGIFRLPHVLTVEPHPATREDLLRVHDEDYVDLIFSLAERNESYDIETPVSREILEATLLIAGGALACGEWIFTGKAKRGISLGGGHHHAGKDYGGGFCLFNDVAILAEFLRNKHNTSRVLILDYDVHFGNGTSDLYYRDPNVLYISIHQDPNTIYPGTGFIWQTGDKEGEGYNVNIPLPPGTGDSTYLYALNEIFVPLAEMFKPDVIIANGGSDSHFADTLGNLRLTVKGFFILAKRILETAKRVCNGQVVLIPGSGYNPSVLPPCWFALAAGIVGLPNIEIRDLQSAPAESPSCRSKTENTTRELKRLLAKRWGALS